MQTSGWKLQVIYIKIYYSDYKFFLPEIMNYKVDRMSMANSLEVRSPFLDHKLVEYILSHKTPYLDSNNSKALLKNYLLNDFDNSFLIDLNRVSVLT